ncbi:MAG: PAS domain-containing protein, partial [Desulfobacteraceae bacterium]|nr:PAS domain-containing protein [Desulfobacteraceae bacterium]
MTDNMFRILDALDAFNDGIYIVNDDYSVTYMNKFMKELFGDGIGKKCYDVIMHSDKPCPWCKNGDVFKKNGTYSHEIFLKSVGKTFSIVELPVLNRDGSKSKLSIYKDLSHELAQEARLKFSEENYKRLFTHAGCGVFTSSKRGRFLDVNPALLTIMGYDDKE